MLTKVNPAHVVAVPVDYNNQKLRVCEALILREVAKEYVSTLFVREDHIVTEDGWIEDEDYPVAEWRDAVAAVIMATPSSVSRAGQPTVISLTQSFSNLGARPPPRAALLIPNAFQLHARIAQPQNWSHSCRDGFERYLPRHLPPAWRRLLCRAWAARAAVGEVQAHIG